MGDRLTDEQLTKLVAEATRLSERDELDREQIEQVLVDLDLSPDLLDDALTQMKRREALGVQSKRRRRWRWLGVAGALVVGGAIALSISNQRQYHQALTQVGTVQERVTLSQDARGQVRLVNRQDNPDVVYRVTLSDAPVDHRLSLSCQWTTPEGQVVRENRYQTRRITTPVWDTHCHYQLGSASPDGTWTVEMFLGDRSISRSTFEVQSFDVQ